LRNPTSCSTISQDWHLFRDYVTNSYKYQKKTDLAIIQRRICGPVVQVYNWGWQVYISSSTYAFLSRYLKNTCVKKRRNEKRFGEELL
jgi:hypothetical protein